MKKKIISSIIAIVLAITATSTAVIVTGEDGQTTQETTDASVAASAAAETTEVTTVISPTEQVEKTTKETTLASKSTTVVQTTTSNSITDYDSELGEFQGVALQYSAPYNITDNKLTRRGGVAYYNGHKETWYSQKVLPGGGLKIPGRHVADDGTIRDENGFICVAADPSFYAKGATLMTSLGPAKVYDCGCAYGIIDVYVNW